MRVWREIQKSHRRTSNANATTAPAMAACRRLGRGVVAMSMRTAAAKRETVEFQGSTV